MVNLLRRAKTQSHAAKSRPEPKWILREATVDDYDQLIACRKAVFPGEAPHKETRPFWEWEFVQNSAGPARYFVAEDDGLIVGGYYVIPQNFLCEGNRHAGSIVVDVMTHPDYRLQGMFTKLGQYAIDACTADPRFEFTTGYPIRPEVMPGHLKVGWRNPLQIKTWVMPLSAGPIAAAKTPLGKIPGLANLAGIAPTAAIRTWNRAFSMGSRVSNVQRGETCMVAMLDEFWQRLSANMPTHTILQERTTEYLAHRYDHNPSYAYNYHVYTDASREALGFAVTRIAPLIDVDAVAIADILVLPGHPERAAVFRSLYADIRNLALENKCALVGMMVTQPNPFVPNPMKFGFLPTPFRFNLITREFANDSVCLRDDIQWHLMWGDTDDL